MTEQQQSPEPQNTPGSVPPHMGRGDWREQRREEREARWHDRAERWRSRSGRWGFIWGGILILLGIVLFLQNSGFPIPLNWWAVFILIPAFGSLIKGWDLYREENRLTRRAASNLVGGTLLTVLALVFLFNIAINTLWPILLIVAGLALIMTGFVPV